MTRRVSRAGWLTLLLVLVVFSASFAAGYSAALGKREAAGVLTPAGETDVPELLAAATRLEAAISSPGLRFRALQRPFVNAAPAAEAGFGALIEGAVTAELGYLEMFIAIEPATATIERPGLLDPFRRELQLIDADGTERLRRASARPAVSSDPASIEAARFTDVDVPVGMGIDLRSARSIPLLLRTLRVERDEPIAGGGHLYAGTAPVTSYPGAVASDLASQTATPITVLVRIDADGNLVELDLRAVNILSPDVEYVTVILFDAPTQTPDWVEKAKP